MAIVKQHGLFLVLVTVQITLAAAQQASNPLLGNLT